MVNNAGIHAVIEQDQSGQGYHVSSVLRGGQISRRVIPMDSLLSVDGVAVYGLPIAQVKRLEVVCPSFTFYCETLGQEHDSRPGRKRHQTSDPSRQQSSEPRPSCRILNCVCYRLLILCSILGLTDSSMMNAGDEHHVDLP
eukprot:357319-Hanusia_phi.AAC.6